MEEAVVDDVDDVDDVNDDDDDGVVIESSSSTARNKRI